MKHSRKWRFLRKCETHGFCNVTGHESDVEHKKKPQVAEERLEQPELRWFHIRLVSNYDALEIICH